MPKDLFKMNEKKMEKEVKKLNDKCEPISQAIISIIAKHDLRPQEYVNKYEEMQKIFSPIHKEIVELMKEKEVTYSEINYIWSVVQTHFNQIKEISVGAIEQGKRLAENKLWNKEDSFEITLQDIDNVLKS